MHRCDSDERGGCCFHPGEAVVGVCALCLNERLLVLASSSNRPKLHQNHSFTSTKALHKIFSLSSLLRSSENNPQKYLIYDNSSSTSQEDDSFISIKFEGNGVARWEKGKTEGPFTGIALNQRWDVDKEAGSVVDHAKPRAGQRWRKRISQLFQLERWRSSNRRNVSRKLGAKASYYCWIRTTAKRKAQE